VSSAPAIGLLHFSGFIFITAGGECGTLRGAGGTRVRPPDLSRGDTGKTSADVARPRAEMVGSWGRPPYLFGFPQEGWNYAALEVAAGVVVLLCVVGRNCRPQLGPRETVSSGNCANGYPIQNEALLQSQGTLVQTLHSNQHSLQGPFWRKMRALDGGSHRIVTNCSILLQAGVKDPLRHKPYYPPSPSADWVGS
jgi:hypothetical protein